MILIRGESICKNSLICKLKTSTLFCKYIIPQLKKSFHEQPVISEQHFMVCRALHSHIPVPFYVTPTSAICPSPLLGRLRKSNCPMRSAQNLDVRRTRTYHKCLGRVPRLAGNSGGWRRVSTHLHSTRTAERDHKSLRASDSGTLAFALAPAMYTPWLSNSL